MSDDPKGTPLLSRRAFIGNTVKLAVAGAILPGALSQVLPAVAPDALGGAGAGPIVRRDPATNAKIPITLSDLDNADGGVLTAEWNFLPAVVYKVKKSVLQGSSNKRGYNTAQYAVQHPNDPDFAIVAYDGKCKHLGCTIGWNGSLGGSSDIPDYNEDGAPDGRVLCPCHQGQYDIYDLALNVPGTPPPSPLNVIELDIGSAQDDNGNTVADSFLGTAKHVQNGYKEADGTGAYPATDVDGNAFSLTSFSLRAPGWSG